MRETTVAATAVRRSLALAAAFPGAASAALICLIAGSGLAIVGPLVLRRVVDDGISMRNASALAVLASAYLGIEALRTAAETLQAYLLRRLTHKVTGRLRREVFRRIQRLPIGWLEQEGTGRVIARSTGDVAALGDALAAGMIGLFRDALILTTVGVLVLFLHPWFGALTIAGSLLVAIPAVLIRRRAQERARVALDASSRTQSILEENVAGLGVIQLFGLESARGEKYRLENHNLLEVSLSALRTRVFFDGAASVTSALALTLLIGVGGNEVTTAGISAGLFIAFVQYAGYLLGTVRGASEKTVAVLSGIAAGERVFETLDRPVGLAAVAARSAETAVRGLTLSNVKFGYRPGVEALKGISGTIREGERLALVGRTGAGKSTLARLLARLHDPWEGEISMDGRDVRSIPPAEFRHAVAFVPQQVFLFSATLLENVRLGDPSVGAEEVMEACRILRAQEFIDRLPRGYETLLGEGGRELSCGQRQLISLARVMVRRRRVLVLDEPTANVDPRTEELILAGMDQVMRGRTTVIIAHRFSTLRSTDRVWVMDEGRMIEEGTPSRVLFKRACGRLGVEGTESVDHGL